MTRFRYTTSLLLSALLYGGVATAVVMLFAKQPPTPKPKRSPIKIALINPPKPPKPQKVATPLITPPTVIPKVQPKPKPKPKKKIKRSKPHPPKKWIKKRRAKPKPKPKKIKPRPKPIEPTILPPEPIVVESPPMIVEEPVVTYTPPPPTPAPQHRPQPLPTPPPVVHHTTPKPIPTPLPAPKEDLSGIKQAFLREVRGNIYANKRYPSVAKRRHLQGTVHVSFTILANGEITNIHTSGASRLLQKAARKSILKSAPLSIPPKLLGQFPMQNVNINIDFKLQ